MEEAFALVGGADGGVRALSEGNVASAMRKIYAEREALGKTLSDTSDLVNNCLLYTSPSPRDQRGSRMPSSA